MPDFHEDGFNEGYGRGYLNEDHDSPQSEGDQYDYQQGIEDGERRRDYTFED